AFKNHILTKKSPQRKANLNAPKYVHSTNVDSVKSLLCMA
ncbi:large ribosomal subunit protein bL35, partial [Helicobacter japonicus]